MVALLLNTTRPKVNITLLLLGLLYHFSATIWQQLPATIDHSSLGPLPLPIDIHLPSYYRQQAIIHSLSTNISAFQESQQ